MSHKIKSPSVLRLFFFIVVLTVIFIFFIRLVSPVSNNDVILGLVLACSLAEVITRYVTKLLKFFFLKVTANGVETVVVDSEIALIVGKGVNALITTSNLAADAAVYHADKYRAKHNIPKLTSEQKNKILDL